MEPYAALMIASFMLGTSGMLATLLILLMRLDGRLRRVEALQRRTDDAPDPARSLVAGP